MGLSCNNRLFTGGGLNLLVSVARLSFLSKATFKVFVQAIQDFFIQVDLFWAACFDLTLTFPFVTLN